MSHTLLHALLEGALIQLEREPLMTLITWGFLLWIVGMIILGIVQALMKGAEAIGRLFARRHFRA